MAKLPIKADTADAQKKIRQLAQEVLKLHKEGSKTINPKIGNGRATMPRAGATGVASGGVGGGSSMALGGAVAGFTGALTTAGISAATAALDKFGLSVLRMTTGISGVSSKIDKYNQAIAVFEEPEKEALQRGDVLDALDDQKRSHKSKTIAHEFGYSKTFRDVAGVEGNGVADKLQAWIDKSLTGSFDELKKTAVELKKLGLTFEDLKSNSTWENLAKIISAYEEAGKDGSNELEPLAQKIFGARQIGAIRKLVEQDWQTLARKQEEDFAKQIPEEQVRTILQHTAQSEAIRRQKEIEALKQPDATMIDKGAQIQLETEQLKTRAIAGDASGIATTARKEFEKETGIDKYHNAIETTLKSFLPAWQQSLFGLNSYYFDEKSGQAQSAKDSWNQGNFIDGALKWILPKAHQELYQLDRWFYDKPQEKIEKIEPVKQPLPPKENNNLGAGMGVEKLTSANNKLANSFSSATNDLVLQLKTNTEATNKMTNAINSQKQQNTVVAGNSTATFA